LVDGNNILLTQPQLLQKSLPVIAADGDFGVLDEYAVAFDVVYF
jgi:hypothetical protein